MPFSKGKFGPTHPGEVKSTGSKMPPASSPREEKHGAPQAAHGGEPVQHVTKTHPGETQPHPTTGVHAFHSHHTGGGKYKSHTHHDGGDVETREHSNHGDMMQAHNEALPPDGEQGQGQDQGMGEGDFSDALSGIGGVGGE